MLFIKDEIIDKSIQQASELYNTFMVLYIIEWVIKAITNKMNNTIILYISSSRMAHPFSIDEKGCKKSRACKPKPLLLENFKCGEVIFEQVLSFPILLKSFLCISSLIFQCPLWPLEQSRGNIKSLPHYKPYRTTFIINN